MKKFQPISNTRCLVIACQELAIPYTFYDDNHNLVGVILDHEYFFANSSTPFNDESIGKIFKDKEFAYKIINNAVKTPRTVGFIDPDCNPDYRSYVKFSNHEEIAKEIDGKFLFPLILKMNSGSRGTNVFKCNNKAEIKKTLGTIFNKMSKDYDYVALAQEYIWIQKEFRVIVFKNKVELVYEKDFSKAKTKEDNISPLHQDNAKAVLIKDKEIINFLTDFVSPLFKKINIGFAGLDIVIDDKDIPWLIELNSKPGFEYFVRDNGDSPLIELYKKMLLFLQKKK